MEVIALVPNVAKKHYYRGVFSLLLKHRLFSKLGVGVSYSLSSHDSSTVEVQKPTLNSGSALSLSPECAVQLKVFTNECG